MSSASDTQEEAFSVAVTLLRKGYEPHKDSYAKALKDPAIKVYVELHPDGVKQRDYSQRGEYIFTRAVVALFDNADSFIESVNGRTKRYLKECEAAGWLDKLTHNQRLVFEAYIAMSQEPHQGENVRATLIDVKTHIHTLTDGDVTVGTSSVDKATKALVRLGLIYLKPGIRWARGETKRSNVVSFPITPPPRRLSLAEMAHIASHTRT